MKDRKHPYRFDQDYREEARLRDGTRVFLRPLCPSDKEALKRGFENLSDTSRYLRFFGCKSTLTARELDHLVDLDGENRFAIVALADEGQPREEGLGVARFARLECRPELAEPALTVVDHAQHKGLATLLLSRLAEAARERGIERFVVEFLAVNQPVRNLLEKYARDFTFEQEGDVMRAEVPIPTVSSVARAGSGQRKNAMFRLLRDSARGTIEVRLRHLLLKNRKRDR